MYHLLERLRDVFASGQSENYLVSDEALAAFMDHCANTIGDAYFRTPRNTIKAFVDLLAIIEQNPDTQWSDLIEVVDLPEDNQGQSDLDLTETAIDGNDELSTFSL